MKTERKLPQLENRWNQNMGDTDLTYKIQQSTGPNYISTESENSKKYGSVGLSNYQVY